MTTSTANSFTRSGKTWAVLLVAAMAWLATSVWAYRVAATHGSLNTAVAHVDPEQEVPSEERARQAAEQDAEKQAKLAAIQQSEEESRQAAELAEAEQASEQRRLADLARQKQEEKDAAARQAEAARLAELAAKEAAARQLQLEARDQAAAQEAERAAEQEQLALLEARDAAAEEARRVAESATRLAAYENLRKEELGVLTGLSARLRFRGRSGVVDRELERVLDSVFDPLFLYAETPVTIYVATNEFRRAADNGKLSRERGSALIAYLVSRGLEEERFDLETDSGDNLPFGSHRVRVLVKEPIE